MNKKRYSITVKKEIPATPDQIWKVWTEPELYNAVHGSFKTDIDFQKDGLISVQFYPDKDTGETFVLQEIEPNKRLVFAWQGSESFQVTLSMISKGETTEVSMTQDCQDNPGWIENCLDGWAWILDSLERYFETGEGFANDEWSMAYGTHRVVERKK